MLITCPHCSRRNRVDEARINQAPSCGHCGHELLSGAPINLDEASFTAVLSACSRPVVVDFWAPWCAPCRGFAPVFAQTAARHPELLFAKIDTDANPQLSASLAIRSIPTLALFIGGKPIERVSGALPAGQFEDWLCQTLARAEHRP